MANKFSSLGSYFQVNTGSLVNIPSVTSLTAPGVNRQYEDVTALDSTGSFAEYRAVVNEPTEVSGQLIWDPEEASHAFLIASAANATMPDEEWAIFFNDNFSVTNSGITFNGSLSRWEPRMQGRETIKVDFAIRVTGAWTYTIGSNT